MASTLNLATLKTPGVYIDEVSLFPPSVAQVETAIPAFIGYTKTAIKDGRNIEGIPTKIKSMVEFRQYFGLNADRNITVTIDANNNFIGAEVEAKFYLFDSMLMFFANGGEKCYIISVGGYTTPVNESHFTDSIEKLQKFDEPTLIVMPDLMRFGAAEIGKISSVQQAAINHCNKMQDRFAILDVQIANKAKTTIEDTDIVNFRSGVSNHLKYAAAYYPWLKTTLPVNANFRSIKYKKAAADVSLDSLLDGTQKTLATITKNLVADLKIVETARPIVSDYNTNGIDDAGKTARYNFIETSITDFNGLTGFTNAAVTALFGSFSTAGTANKAKKDAVDASFATLANDGTNPLKKYDDAFNEVLGLFDGLIAEIENLLQASEGKLLAEIPFYKMTVDGANSQGVVIPPSGAIAGIYASVDNNRGVWKSPANVGITNIISPSIFIDNDEHEDLNVDTTAGKSINAIRFFTGKGTLVWGARTLAGNDNEWRYVSVRRFFNMVEESVKKASEPFVFEPNDANTWVKVRAMIENFLVLQWRAGALAGAKPDHAFYVRVGLNETMTAIDILEGRMIIEIGMAVVRPAEFIVLRFSHKMQES